MEEYDGMFWDCHAGNEYVGDIVSPTAPLSSSQSAQARERYRKSLERAQDNERRLAELHALGECPNRCVLCAYDRRN